jgi:ATP/maltotriose-dependent transcriptional regulator MalT/DNA-binding SARP family transcriptional activator
LAALASSRVAVVEAGAGYGKSVLASQLREALGLATAYVPLDCADAAPAMLIASLRRALRAARLSDLVAAVGEWPSEPSAWVERLLDILANVEGELLLIFDDAHRLGSEAASLVVRVARGLPAGHRLVVCARRLAGPLASGLEIEGAVRLDAGALAFTVDEAQELVEGLRGRRPGSTELRSLVDATGGWATALVLSASGGSDPAAASSAVRGSELIAAALRRILEPVSGRDRNALSWLAHLPLVSPGLCQALAGELAFERFVEAGLPLARTASGWWELPGPVAEELAARAPLPEHAARAAADVYLSEGELLAAVRVLLARGLTLRAAALLERVLPRDLEELGVAALRDLAEALPDESLAAHPGVLLHLARIAEATQQRGIRTAALDRARRLLAVAGNGVDTAVRLELDAEVARDLAWDERTRTDARALAYSVVDRASEAQVIARARALDVLGRIMSWLSSDGPLPEAERLLSESARLARRIGQPTWAAQALVPLAVGLHFAQCRFERALEILDEALAELPARNPYRVNVLTWRAEVLVEVGRYAEAETCVAEMREIGRLSREQWMLAYAFWNEANAASYQGDGPRAAAAVSAAEQHRDEWFWQPSGVEFLAQAADCLDRAGEQQLARDYLRRARDRVAGIERPVRLYEAAVLARSGPPREGRQVVESALAETAVEPQQRWPLMVLRAYAALRGEDPDAGRLAAEAFDACAALGHPEGPLLRERKAAEALLPVAAAAGSRAAAGLLERGTRIQVRLLGGFEVRRAGRVVELPAGRPAKAVRAVAAAGGRMHAEELIELLWPQAPLDVGRNRLRNLLSRLRLAGGELLLREQEIVMLASGCDVDADWFAADARAALAARSGGEPRRAEALARGALERYRGDLLPDDRYEGWAAGTRERLRMQFLELLDILASGAEQRAEIDEAARVLERALDAEPYDEQRYVRLARLLSSQGRAGSALATLRRARAALDELGLGPSAELEGLERSLRRRGSTQESV